MTATPARLGPIVVVVLALAGVAVGSGPAQADPTSFPDVPADHPFAADIAWLVDEGLTTGYPDGTFRPTEPITRQTAAAMLQRLAEPHADLDPDDPTPFTDIGPGDPFHGEVRWLADLGVTNGYPDGTFRPTAPVSRQELAAFLFRLWGGIRGTVADGPSFSDVPESARFWPAIHWAAVKGIVEGRPDGTFGPGDVVTRQAAAAMVRRFAAATRPGGPEPPGLARRIYDATSLTDAGAPVPLVAGTQVLVGFGRLLSDEGIGADAGCNTLGGDYELVGDQILVTATIITAMGCEPAREAQDAWVFSLLDADPTYALDGEVLTLTAGDKVMVLDARPWPWPGQLP